MKYILRCSHYKYIFVIQLNLFKISSHILRRKYYRLKSARKLMNISSATEYDTRWLIFTVETEAWLKPQKCFNCEESWFSSTILYFQPMWLPHLQYRIVHEYPGNQLRNYNKYTFHYWVKHVEDFKQKF